MARTAGRAADVTRVALALVLAAGAAVNAYFATQSGYLEPWGKLAFFPFVTWIVGALLVPIEHAFFALVAAFELACAVALLQRGRVVRLAAALAGVFFLGTVLLGWYEVPNLVLAAILALLAIREFPESIAQRMRRHRQASRRAKVVFRKVIP